MDSVMLKGQVASDEIKVLKTNRGVPLCRFAIRCEEKVYSCLITGKQAYSFLFEVEKGCELSLTARVNERSQLVIIHYALLSEPSYFGKIYNYRGHPLPRKSYN